MIDKTRNSIAEHKEGQIFQQSGYHIVVTELDETFPRRFREKPHLYVELSTSAPREKFERLKLRAGGKFARGHHVCLHQNAPKYEVHTDRAKAKAELKRCKEILVREGHPVNNVKSTWADEFIVYVLDLDPAGKEKQMTNEDGTRKAGYVYVGRSANTLEVRVAQHRRQRTSRTGRDIGAKPTKNRSFTVREHYVVFTDKHSAELEEQVAANYEQKNFLVEAGDVTPRKLERKAAKIKTSR